jgi:hypothetical protein
MSPGAPQNWEADGMSRPDFFVVGAPKCATTAMHAYLKQHPAIFMPQEKELHHYGSDLAGLPSTLSEAAHHALFDGAENAVRIGETCIWALYSENGPREIYQAHPQAQIVILLRNPVEMLYALHNEYLIHAIEDIAVLARALDAEPDRKRGKRLPRNGLFPPQIYAYHDIATFSIQVERYFHTFGRDRVHVILYDDLKRDTATVFRRLLEFLGVDPSFTPEFQVINPSRRLRSVRLQRLLVASSGLTQGSYRRILPFKRERILKIAGALEKWNLRSKSRPPMMPALRRRLEGEFAVEFKRLAELIDRDLSHWSTRAAS